ncbi:MAG TPA: MaoC family dehydratase [Spirillospora sp.]
MTAPATTPVTVTGVDGAKSLEGRDLGPTPYIEVTQEMVDKFADVTGDHQWIHVDRERAEKGPFGGTIAHGFLTLSLTPVFMPQLVRYEGFSMGVNYGCNKVRFPAPVPVGSKLRARARVESVTDVPGGVQSVVTLTFEVEGQEKPSCVATVLLRHYV